VVLDLPVPPRKEWIDMILANPMPPTNCFIYKSHKVGLGCSKKEEKVLPDEIFAADTLE
jgi:hypothetical protein